MIDPEDEIQADRIVDLLSTTPEERQIRWIRNFVDSLIRDIEPTSKDQE